MVRKDQKVPHLRLVRMPKATATFLGRLYAKAPPEGRLPHPQDRLLWETKSGLLCVKELWRVANSEVVENGIYAIMVLDKEGSEKVLLSEASLPQQEFR